MEVVVGSSVECDGLHPVAMTTALPELKASEKSSNLTEIESLLNDDEAASTVFCVMHGHLATESPHGVSW